MTGKEEKEFISNPVEAYENVVKQLARKTQELEQKEKELKELKRQYKLSCLDCEYKNTKADVDRYRKALEEIEKYTIKQFCENCDDFNTTEYNSHCEYCEYYEYFDIINKAKGEE